MDAGRPLWWDRPLPPADLYVVGLGATGLAACIEARRRGARVVGLDAGRIGGGASSRNGGFLLAGGAPFPHAAPNPELYAATVAEIAALARSLPGCVRAVGSERRWATDDERADCEAHAAALVASGFRAEMHTRHLLLPDDAAFDPLARTVAWATKARAAGALLLDHVRAVPDAATVATLTAGTVLVCIDGGIETVLPALGPQLRTARLQMLATAPTTEVRMTRPVYSRHGYDYWQQLPDGRVLLGGCRDRHGDDEWSLDAHPTDAVQADLDALLRDGLGVRRTEVTHRWAGLSAYPADGRGPVVGAVSERVLVATGYSGTGNVVGPLAGRALVALALDGTAVPAWLGRPPATS